MFRFNDLMHLANNLFAKEGRKTFMRELRDKGPFNDIFVDEVNQKIVNLVIDPRICWKLPCEEYSKMNLCNLKTHTATHPRMP